MAVSFSASVSNAALRHPPVSLQLSSNISELTCELRDLGLATVPPRWAFLKIETDEGVFDWGGPVVEGRALIVRAAVHELPTT